MAISLEALEFTDRHDQLIGPFEDLLPESVKQSLISSPRPASETLLGLCGKNNVLSLGRGLGRDDSSYKAITARRYNFREFSGESQVQALLKVLIAIRQLEVDIRDGIIMSAKTVEVLTRLNMPDRAG